MNTSDVLGVVGVTIAIISLVVAVYLYFAGQRVRKPRWAISTVSLVQDSKGAFDKLEVRYAGRDVKSLAVSKIAIWNAGRETIRRSDIAPSAPIRVVAPEGRELLDATLTTQSDSVCSVAVVYTGNEARIDFDFLDYEQGAMATVVHTGDVQLFPRVSGTILGAGPFQMAPIRPAGEHSGKNMAFVVMEAIVGAILFETALDAVNSPRILLATMAFIGTCLLGTGVLRLPDRSTPIRLGVVPPLIQQQTDRTIFIGRRRRR